MRIPYTSFVRHLQCYLLADKNVRFSPKGNWRFDVQLIIIHNFQIRTFVRHNSRVQRTRIPRRKIINFSITKRTSDNEPRIPTNMADDIHTVGIEFSNNKKTRLNWKQRMSGTVHRAVHHACSETGGTRECNWNKPDPYARCSLCLHIYLSGLVHNAHAAVLSNGLTVDARVPSAPINKTRI